LSNILSLQIDQVEGLSFNLTWLSFNQLYWLAWSITR